VTSGRGVQGSCGTGPWGFLGSSTYGVYGARANGDNQGYLGGAAGAWGWNTSNNTGWLGGTDHGAYGENSDGDFGCLGSWEPGWAPTVRSTRVSMATLAL
jgi:hypothetical protein